MKGTNVTVEVNDERIGRNQMDDEEDLLDTRTRVKEKEGESRREI